MGAADAILACRQAFLQAFRWVDGHADIAGVFRDREALSSLGPGLAALFADEPITVVAAPEARAFVLGALVAEELGVGLLLVRKAGSIHPGELLVNTSAPDWRRRETTFRIRKDAVSSEDRVLVVDDWVETGSQVTAVRALLDQLGAMTVGTAALVRDCDEDVATRIGLRAVVSSGELQP